MLPNLFATTDFPSLPVPAGWPRLAPSNKDHETSPLARCRTYGKPFTFNNLQDHLWGRTQSYLTYLPRHLPCYHVLVLYCVILLSGSIATVAKKDTYIPSRRTGKGPLGAKVFSYYTQDERRLVEKAAKLEHRSLSSFVAIAAVERAQRVLGRN